MRFPLKTIAQLDCCLAELKTRVENGVPSGAITDIVESTAEGTETIDALVGLSDFNALVGNFNTLVSDHNSVVVALNAALQALRDQNIIES